MKISKDILKACCNNDRVAQKQVYELLLPYLRAVAKRYLRDASFVKDVLQESFYKIFKNLDSYDPQRAPLNFWALLNIFFSSGDTLNSIRSSFLICASIMLLLVFG